MPCSQWILDFAARKLWHSRSPPKEKVDLRVCEQLSGIKREGTILILSAGVFFSNIDRFRESSMTETGMEVEILSEWTV